MTDEPDSVDELISRYLDGEATDAEITRVEGDPDLLARAGSIRAAIEAVAAPVTIPTVELDRIRAAAIAESTTTTQVTDLMAAGAARQRTLERRNRIMAVAAAFVLLAVGVVAVRSAGVDDDDSTEAADTASSDDSGDSSDAGSDDSGDDSDDSFQLESDGDFDDDMADEEESMAEADDMAEEEDDMAEEDSGETTDDAAESAPAALLDLDLLPDELDPVDTPEALYAAVLAFYDEPDAEAPQAEGRAGLLDELCDAALALVQDGQPAGTVGIEFASVELAGAPTTVIVATGADGSLVVLAHPIDDCAAVTLVEG